MELIFIVFCL